MRLNGTCVCAERSAGGERRGSTASFLWGNPLNEELKTIPRLSDPTDGLGRKKQ